METESTQAAIEALLDEQRTFPPPEEFAAQAVASEDSVYRRADEDPEGFWRELADEFIGWFKEPTKGLEWDPPHCTWFADGELNVAWNCLDRHVEDGQGDRVAYHWVGEPDGERADLTYAEMLREVSRLGNALRNLGVSKGDRVGIYMGMVPELPIAMLACARIGAPHVVVFGGFSSESLAERLRDSGAKLLITQDEGWRKGGKVPLKENADAAADAATSVERLVVFRRTGDEVSWNNERDLWWHDVVEGEGDECEPERMGAEDTLFLLHTSGTTAKPKGVQHTSAGYLLHVAVTHKWIFDIHDDTIWWCPADVGWVTGHSYIVYGPLANGTTSVLYEGAPDYPDKDIHWEIVEKLGVTIYYFAPTAIRAFMKWGPEYPQKHDLSSLRLLGTVGEPINPKAWLWYHKVIGGERCPIVDTWWQTETGAIMITTLPGVLATKPGSAGRPLPGIQAAVVNEANDDAGTEQGFLTLTRPWPGMLRTLYKEEDRFIETYWSRFGERTYAVGDAARRDDDDYLWIIGRIDDVLNVSGHRMSTAEIESAIVSYSRVAEAAVIGQSDEDTGQSVTAFVTLEGGGEGSDELIGEIREHVAKRIGKLARPKRIIWADDLPKTRSGKIMRRLLRDIAEGRELGDVTTLRDPDVMAELDEKIKERQSEEE